MRLPHGCWPRWLLVALAVRLAWSERRDGLDLHILSTDAEDVRPAMLDEDQGNLSNGSIAYSALHARTEAFLKASRNYQVQVKGPLIDATDVYLNRKDKYEQSMRNLDDGERKQHRLIHMMRTSLKNQHGEHMEEFQNVLDADLDELNSSNSSSSSSGEDDEDEDEDEDKEADEDEDEEEDEDEDEAEEGPEKDSKDSAKTPEESGSSKAKQPTAKECAARKKAKKGTEIWCGCNTNSEPIDKEDACEDQGGGRNTVCKWSAEASACLPKGK
ncbi:unnamed protein product [Symbiodinium sp. CCMP2592]|nr:unnamed protein product [Symbiodinium sp. CCMP2592]